MAPFS
jgi:hypothetical protein